MKPCPKCGAVENISTNGQCRPCRAAYTRAKLATATPEQKAAKKAYMAQWLSANRDKVRAQQHEWLARRIASEPNYIENRKRRLVVDPTRTLASACVRRAIYRGHIKRMQCWVCGDPKSVGHHASYARDAWLDVVWLCRSHHKLLHEQFRRHA